MFEIINNKTRNIINKKGILTMILSSILIVIGFVLLIVGADLLVDGASGIAKNFHIPEIIIGPRRKDRQRRRQDYKG